MIRVTAFALICTTALLAQSPAPRPAFDAFEVATIKPANPDLPGRYIRMQSTNRFYARNHTLKTLIQAAWNLTPRAVTASPSWVDSKWLDSEKFEIVAKTPGDIRPNADEQMTMLRQLLADRFKLTFHREQKDFAIFTLTVAKSGSRLKESIVSPDATPEGPPLLAFVLGPDGVSLPARYTTMADFCSVLQRAALDRPVIDKTGLTGAFDFDLDWTPDATQFGGAAASIPGAAASGKSDLFTALQQQLGLKLEATRGPVATLIIDHAEKPGDN